MPLLVHSIDLDFPIKTIWKWINSNFHCLTVIPGYIHHEVISDQQFVLSVQAKFGMWKRNVKVHSHIIQRNEPNYLQFDFASESNHIQGKGELRAKQLQPKRTRVTLSLEFSGQGAVGQIMNTLLKNFDPTQEITPELADAISKNIKEVG
ncbi:SRPBCC family protein [Caldibacillus lycopersici]|uniref:SRPBCC family protein n=1 Tax=Perspicuibacillus lycopersici TaxID=1325689 RepID=A0AAE3IQM4_9BACI|nr:SRPBCC family protein [Perspicuibacillus lycopersici]MCU9612616.1 SRPBCC family protein [Perspicuibacillus lycopersici]